MKKIKRFNQSEELILEKDDPLFKNILKVALASKLEVESKPPPPPPTPVRPTPTPPKWYNPPSSSNIRSEGQPKKADPKTPPQTSSPKPSSGSSSGSGGRSFIDPNVMSFGSFLGGEASRMSSALFGKHSGYDEELDRQLRKSSEPWMPKFKDMPTISDVFSAPSPHKFRDPFFSEEDIEKRRKEGAEGWKQVMGRGETPKPQPKPQPIGQPKKVKASQKFSNMLSVSDLFSILMDSMEEETTSRPPKSSPEATKAWNKVMGKEETKSQRLSLDSGMPLPGLAIAQYETVSVDETFSIITRNISQGKNIVYGWQASMNGQDWINLRGENKSEITLNQSVDCFYRMITTDKSSNKSNVTNSVLVRMEAPQLLGMKMELEVQYGKLDRSLQMKVEYFINTFVVPILERCEKKIREQPEKKKEFVSEMVREVNKLLDDYSKVDYEIVDSVRELISNI